MKSLRPPGPAAAGRTRELARDSGSIPLKASFFTAFLCVLFGANAVAIKMALAGIGVFTCAGIRFGCAAMAIAVWAGVAGKPLALSRRQFRQLAILGLVFFVQLSLYYLGLSKTTASHTTLIANVLPFVVLVLAHFFIAGDTISRRKLLGLVLGFGGVLMLLGDTVELSRDALAGDLIVLAAILIWGGNAIYTKRIIVTLQPSQATFYPVALATPLFLLAGLILDEEMVTYVDAEIVVAMLYQSFVTASFGLLGWMTMMKRYGATALHSFIFIMPLSGVFFGVVLLGEPLTANLAGAILLVTTGLVVLNRDGARQIHHPT